MILSLLAIALLASLLWSAALLAIFAPLATYLYRRRTTDCMWAGTSV